MRHATPISNGARVGTLEPLLQLFTHAHAHALSVEAHSRACTQASALSKKNTYTQTQQQWLGPTLQRSAPELRLCAEDEVRGPKSARHHRED
ncbi:hypothetical protein chiPu_0022544 [Chiloscyllium punctatum]|uniref:Uncharacterized protein n=1 Tax=Chiloscyllium punctatum TaxID=137246 RepID=A0A401RKH7_CHIPU|nr:hypothetical protein [Chiloscyllium punctatum]